MAQYNNLYDDIKIIPMKQSDIEGVLKLQDAIYPISLRERKEVLTAKLFVYPLGCWIAINSLHMVGYILSHPWTTKYPPMLDVALEKLPMSPDCYYIHDLVVSSNNQGGGLGRRLLNKAQNQAQEENFKKITLVAVNNSSSFWSRFGFRAIENITLEAETILPHYSNDAKYMMKYI